MQFPGAVFVFPIEVLGVYQPAYTAEESYENIFRLLCMGLNELINSSFGHQAEF